MIHQPCMVQNDLPVTHGQMDPSARHDSNDPPVISHGQMDPSVRHDSNDPPAMHGPE